MCVYFPSLLTYTYVQCPSVGDCLLLPLSTHLNVYAIHNKYYVFTLHTIRSVSSFSVVNRKQFYSPEDFACGLLSTPRVIYVPVSCRLHAPSACAARAHLTCAHPARARAPRAHHSRALVVTHRGQSLMLVGLSSSFAELCF